MNARAGTAIGRLLLAGIITEAQHDGATRLFALHDCWRSMAGIPSRHPRAMDPGSIMGPAPADVDSLEWARVSGLLSSVYEALTPIQRAAIDTVVLDDFEPPAMRGHPPAVATLRTALDALAVRFVFGRRREAA